MIKITPQINISIKQTINSQRKKICSISKNLIDTFTNSSNTKKGLEEIREIQAGKYGTVCKGAKPLMDFVDIVGDEKYEKLLIEGISTNREGWANSFLKSKSNIPLSTSSVQDCSVMYLFNEKAKTHFLFHTYYQNTEKDFLKIINTFMPEGFDKANIVPGNKYWLDRHKQTLPEMFKAIKKSNPKANVNVSYNSSKLPEIICYNGEVYETPNQLVMLGFDNSGQASFKICNLNEETLNYIKNAGDTSKEILKIKDKILTKNYTPEITEIFNQILNQRLAMIKDIENCSTLEELKELISYLKPIEVIENFKCFEIQKAKILSTNKTT